MSDTGASYSDAASIHIVKTAYATLALDNQANPFAWTYTTAGKLKSQSDPAIGSTFSAPDYTNQVQIDARLATYDQTTGVLSSLTLPDGLAYNNIKYDPEGS